VQLRILNTAEATINRILPVIGRLNAISPLGDPQRFAQNLGQLVSQKFEVQDLRELVGASPIAGQLIKEVFGVDSPINGAAIRASAKKLGIDTADELLNALALRAENHPALRSVTESLGGQFEKVRDRLNVALAPLGETLARTLLPLFDDLVSAAERYGREASNVFARNKNDILQTAREVGHLALEIGKLAGKIVQVGSESGVFRKLAEFAAITTDFLSGDINFFSAGPREAAVQQKFAALDADRARRARFSQHLGPFGDIDEITNFLRAGGAGGRGRGGAGGAGGVGGTGTGGGGGVRQRDRFINDFGQGEAEKLFHEAALAAVRQSNLGRVLRRQAPFDLQALPRLSAAGLGAPDLGFPGGELADLARIAAEVPAKIAPIMSDVERFMRGFEGQIESVGDAFERFGSNVAFAFTNVKTLFASLKQAVLGFFNDLIGNALQNLVRGTLGGIFGGGGGGGIGNLFGNLFRSPAFASAGGNGISAPASISQSFGSFFSGGGGSSSASGFGKLALDPLTAKEFGIGGSFLGGIGKSFAAAAPLLGLSLGAGLGGQSVFGQIAGSAGGLLGGGAVAGFSGLLGKAATKFFTNPFTIAIGAGLLVGSFFLGRAKQRKQDEELSGQFLTQALAGIDQLASAVSSGQITTLVEARSIFDSQILGVFAQQIGGLKTKSVRESRLTNQVRDLRNQFEIRIPPLINEANQRRIDAERAAIVHSRLIPEFGTGGTARGGLAFLHPGEKVLNFQQQSAVQAMAGANVFERAGVPGVQHSRVFDNGGIMPAGRPEPIVIEQLVVSIDSESIAVKGMSGDPGRQVIIRQVIAAKRNEELK
jgi:hypothetical protein